MKQESRSFERVGACSTPQAAPEDCQRCHNAILGTIIVDRLCLDCHIEKVAEGKMLIQVEAMALGSLSPEGDQHLEDAFEELRMNRHIPTLPQGKEE